MSLKHYFVALFILVGMIGIALGATVTNNITYQGKLTDETGNPLPGTYTFDMTFRLYHTESGGTPYAKDTHEVTVTDGLFTTPVSFDPQYFDGRPLWLSIEVKSDGQMTPRQELRPVPYALSLRPGAILTGALDMPQVLEVNNPATNSDGIIITSKGDSSRGIFSRTTGANSPAIYGDSSQDVGVYGRGKEGGYFTTNSAGTSSLRYFGVNISTLYDYNYGVYAVTSGNNSHGLYAKTSGGGSDGAYILTDGDYSDGLDIHTDGYRSDGVRIIASGDNSYGVHAETYSPESPAVYGVSNRDVGIYGRGREGGDFTTNAAGTKWPGNAGVNVSTAYRYNPGLKISTTGYNSEGVYIDTDDSYSDGIFIEANGPDSRGVVAQTYGDSSEGVWAVTQGEDSVGVYAFSAQDVGVFGVGREGGYFTTNQGYFNSTGVEIYTRYPWSDGIEITTEENNSTGVEVVTTNSDSWGMYTRTEGENSHGAYITVTGKGSEGIYVYSKERYGVWARSNASFGIYATTDNTNNQYGLYTPDYIYAKGTHYPTEDVAEYMPVAENATPGTVLIIGDDGRLTPSTTAYDTRVAGIISTDPGIFLGTKEEGNEGEALIAIAGRVPCKVDASYGAIHPGDVLTTSPTPGRAMKAQPVDIGGVEIYKPSTVLGKALQSLESGTGTIEVLVTLQ